LPTIVSSAFLPDPVLRPEEAAGLTKQ